MARVHSGETTFVPPPGFMIKTQVRLGVGAMPRFSRDELSAGQLDDLVTYLEALRRHG